MCNRRKEKRRIVSTYFTNWRKQISKIPSERRSDRGKTKKRWRDEFSWRRTNSCRIRRNLIFSIISNRPKNNDTCVISSYKMCLVWNVHTDCTHGTRHCRLLRSDLLPLTYISRECPPPLLLRFSVCRMNPYLIHFCARNVSVLRQSGTTPPAEKPIETRRKTLKCLL
jgi:hypothetical protein